MPSWTAAGGARGVCPLPHSPLSSTAPIETLELVPYGSTNIRISVFPQLCDAGKPGCPPPSPPPPHWPSPGPKPQFCHPPPGQNAPNMKLDTNLPNGDLVPGGSKLALFNVSECYQRRLEWNANLEWNAKVWQTAHGEHKPRASCDAWVAVDAKLSGQHKPWCWLKSHGAHGGYTRRPQQCFVSAECRVAVPPNEFPCRDR